MKEFCSKYSYTRRLDSTVDAVLVLYLPISPGPPIRPPALFLRCLSESIADITSLTGVQQPRFPVPDRRHTHLNRALAAFWGAEFPGWETKAEF